MNQRAAFSLVELSIVLVILGLLTGGILAGQSLIRASELRTVTGDYTRYVTASQSFRDKYFALPGDMTNATKFWGLIGGTEAANDAVCQVLPSTTGATCNGNGDGQIAATYERWRFWQHLVSAGLIEGSYNGVAGSLVPGLNFPTSRLGSSTRWTGYWPGTVAGTTQDFAIADAGNWLVLADNVAPQTVMSPPEAWNIDTKMDDGLANQGRIIAYKGDATNTCTSRANQAVAAADASATYNLASNAKSCFFYFLRAF